MCFQKRYFLCENNYGTIQLVRQPLTWEEAEQHCKKNHKSLVTITDLKNMLNSYPRCAWIGLFRYLFFLFLTVYKISLYVEESAGHLAFMWIVILYSQYGRYMLFK